MNNQLTDITLVIDRSGSMESCREDMQGGLNTFIADQAKQPGDAKLTLVQFDTDYDFVHNGVPIKEVPKYELVPRGGTALYDAVGRAVNETGERLAALPEEDRPGLVIVAIVTDGGENASREFTGEQVKALIERQTKDYNWQFTYLGANQDAFQVSATIGIAAASTMNYSTANSGATMDSLSYSTTNARLAASKGAPVAMGYTKADRDAAMAVKPKTKVASKAP